MLVVLGDFVLDMRLISNEIFEFSSKTPEKFTNQKRTNSETFCVVVSICLKSFLHLHLLSKICERVRQICTVDKMYRVYHLDKDKGIGFTLK